VERKTASLFALAAIVGSYLAKPRPKMSMPCASSGEPPVSPSKWWTIFWILPPKRTSWENFRHGPEAKDSLAHQSPLVISGDPKSKDFFELESPTLEQSQAARNYLRTSVIVDQARAIALDYCERAKARLREVTQDGVREDARTDLLALVDYTLERCM